MREMMRNRLKNEKGFTLIELLAVIVILAIILAIAIPAVTTLINNSRIDSHIANAQQMESSAKLFFAENPNATSVNLDKLVEDGYLDPIDDPHDKGYSGTASEVKKVTKTDDTPNGYETILSNGTEPHYLSGKSASEYIRDDFNPPADD